MCGNARERAAPIRDGPSTPPARGRRPKGVTRETGATKHYKALHRRGAPHSRVLTLKAAPACPAPTLFGHDHLRTGVSATVHSSNRRTGWRSARVNFCKWMRGRHLAKDLTAPSDLRSATCEVHNVARSTQFADALTRTRPTDAPEMTDAARYGIAGSHPDTDDLTKIVPQSARMCQFLLTSTLINRRKRIVHAKFFCRLHVEARGRGDAATTMIGILRGDFPS